MQKNAGNEGKQPGNSQKEEMVSTGVEPATLALLAPPGIEIRFWADQNVFRFALTL
jgi:hypothetical protein